MATFEISKTYDPKAVEPFWAKFWVSERLARSPDAEKKGSFVIVIPPPNVTGSLHMGHALNNTLQDILVRYRRMNGSDALWVPGTDHGGIATQNVVEKLLKQEGKSRHDLGREKFLERMWRWREESGGAILMQLERLGCLLDWQRTRFTMDETCSRAVGHAFGELYRRGWIYRGKRMVNWCVRCHTALSDIEVEYEERKDKLYYIRYPIQSGKLAGLQGTPLIVATTRPETMLGDTAVAVHPEDPRYEKIHGWWVELPLMDRQISVIKDRAVDPKFGTGVVKVTPAHDPADFDMGQTHHLEQIVVIGPDGKMTEAAGKYAGLSREECRKKVMEDLAAQDLVEKVEDYRHSVGTCYRCGVIVEPLLSDQWFLKVEEMAKEAHQATKRGLVRIFPESWEKPYLNWLENLKDWCISRQIWWGHRIPVWYCIRTGEAKDMSEHRDLSKEEVLRHPAFLTKCPPIPSAANPEKCPHCGGSFIMQDPDVLDTWFSSALWPFSVFGWPEANADLKKYYPTSVLVTGHEILYLWVARMVMFGLTFDPRGAGTMEGKIPFSHVFIHGIVRDKQGRKMSKSLGNVIDPLSMMERFGTDALRFVLASQSVPGRDMQIADDTFVGARNFTNKIWNVSRYYLMTLQKAQEGGLNAGSGIGGPLAAAPGKPKELCDRWILSRYHETIREVRQSLEEYNIAQASRTLYQFIWSEFCDWYVELSKIRTLQEGAGAEKQAALAVCDRILTGILRLLHPVMPFITEEIWKNLQALAGRAKTESLLQEPYPAFDAECLDAAAESKMALLMSVIGEVRTVRAEMNVPPGSLIELLLNAADAATQTLLKEQTGYLRHLCRADRVEIGSALKKPGHAAAAVASHVEIFIPLEGLIDFEKEKKRIDKEIGQAEADLAHLEKRLALPDFRSHAPEEEVKRTEERRNLAQEKLKRLRAHRESIAA